MVGFRAGTGVPTAQKVATDYESSAMATTTRGGPTGLARLWGRSGNGVASGTTTPETSEIRYTGGGRTSPRFATSCAALGGPPLCGLVVMVFGPSADPYQRLYDSSP